MKINIKKAEKSWPSDWASHPITTRPGLPPWRSDHSNQLGLFRDILFTINELISDQLVSLSAKQAGMNRDCKVDMIPFFHCVNHIFWFQNFLSLPSNLFCPLFERMWHLLFIVVGLFFRSELTRRNASFLISCTTEFSGEARNYYWLSTIEIIVYT